MNGLGAYLRAAADNRAPSRPGLDIDGGFSVANVVHKAFDIHPFQVGDSLFTEQGFDVPFDSPLINRQRRGLFRAVSMKNSLSFRLRKVSVAKFSDRHSVSVFTRLAHRVGASGDLAEFDESQFSGFLDCQSAVFPQGCFALLSVRSPVFDLE